MHFPLRGEADPTRRTRPTSFAIGLAVTLVSGCEFRDEPVRTAAAPGIWASAGGDRPAMGASGRPAGDAAEVDYVQGYEAAIRSAAAEGRPLLLVFVASWCRWSGELARGPLADRGVVTRTRRCVCVLLDADRDAAICRSFGVEAFPTVILADAGGRERFRGTGAAAAIGLAAALDAVPAGAGRDRLATDPPRAGAGEHVTR